MKKLIGLLSVLAVLSVLFGASSLPAMAQGGKKPLGSVALKGLAGSHSGTSKGQGQVTPLGGYYVAPAVGCTVNITDLDLPNGTKVTVILEYLAGSNLAPVTVGTITLSSKAGSLSTLANPTPVSTSAGLATMSIRSLDGTLLLSGSIKGL